MIDDNLDLAYDKGLKAGIDVFRDLFKNEMMKLSKMRHTDKKHHDVILWTHIREVERRLMDATK